MPDEKLPPIPPIPPPPADPPPPPPSSKSKGRSKSGAFRHLDRNSRADRLQDFARTGFAGYRRVVVKDRRRGPGWVWIFISILLLIAIGFGIFQWARSPAIDDSAPEDFAAIDGDSPVISSKIDPEAWRGDLESFETFLFSPPSEIGPLGDFGERFKEEAGLFAERLRADGGAQEATLADELDGLIPGTERSDFNIRRLKEVRGAWLGIREIRLADAEWLSDDQGVDEAADLEIYRQAAEQIQGLLSDTLSTAEELSGAGLSSQERHEEWRQTLFYFRDDLKVIRAALPRRPTAGAPAAELDAIHQLDRIFIQAEDIAARHQNLSRFDPTDFESAIENAQEAAAFFDRRL